MILLIVIAFAICLAPLSGLTVCAMVIRRRRRSGTPVVIPVGAAISSLLGAAWVAVSVLPVFRAATASDPAVKATLLSLGISGGLNCGAFIVVIGAPLLVAAFLLDRWMLRSRGPLNP